MIIPDIYQIENLFSEGELSERHRVRDFVDEKIIAQVHLWNRKGQFPKELIPEMAKLGIFGASLSGYGCPGKSHTVYGLMMQELERGDSGFRSFASVQSGLAMYPIHEFGSEEQKNRWLPRMATGEAIGCFALTEPDYGSNPAGLITRAEEDNGHYILNGHKRWCTSAPIADVAVVFAKLNDRIRGFLVEKDTPGFSPKEIRGKLSLRVSVSSEIIFEECRIPKENILPGAEGLKSALMCLNQARYSIAWGVIGAALACFEEALGYATKRTQFDRPIAGFQMVQSQLAQMWTDIVKAQLLAHRLGRLMDEGKADPAAVSMAKRNNVQMAMEVARNCRDILGAVGILDEYQVMRHMNNLESVYTYEGTHNIHTLILGETLTGISAFA